MSRRPSLSLELLALLEIALPIASQRAGRPKGNQPIWTDASNPEKDTSSRLTLLVRFHSPDRYPGTPPHTAAAKDPQVFPPRFTEVTVDGISFQVRKSAE